MTSRTRRRLMDRKIVELLLTGAGVNSVARDLRVGKKRVSILCKQAKKYSYLTEAGGRGAVVLPPYPESVFPDAVDKRSLQASPQEPLLDPHRAWMEERLCIRWHAVSVFEALPVAGISRSVFYRYLVRHKLNRLGEEDRGVVPEIIHQPGEALLVDWGKLCDGYDPASGRERTVCVNAGVKVSSFWRSAVYRQRTISKALFPSISQSPFFYKFLF